MVTELCRDQEPPGYEMQPVVSAIPKNPAFPFNQLSVHENTKVINFGELLQGTIEVIPRQTISCSKITMKLIIVECATGPSKLFSMPKWKGRQVTQLLTSIPTTTMKAGSKYVYPFVAEIPQLSEETLCSCGSAHARFPPSLGNGREASDTEFCASIRYLLTVSVVDTGLVCVKELFMEPKEPILINYAGLTDASGLDMDREYTVSNRVTSGRLSNKLLGYLSLTGSPITCDAYGYSRVKLGLDIIACEGAAPFSQGVQQVKCTLYRVIYSSRSRMGLQLAASDTTEETKIKVCEAQTTYLMGEDSSGEYIDMLVKLPVRQKLMPPPFVSCYTAVKYELQIKVFLKGSTGSISLPMSFGNSEFNTPVEAPEYSE